MSELDKRIEQWRTDLTTSETLGNSDIHELETHLREEIAKLTTSGLSDDEAFVVASRRLGNKPALEAEFAKAHPHRRLAHRLYWMVIGVLGYYLLLHVTSIAAWGTAWLGYAAGVRTWQHLAVVTAIVRLALFAAGSWFALRCYTSYAQTTARNVPISIRASIFLACAVLASWWIGLLPNVALDRIVPHECYTCVYSAQCWAGFGWGFMMPFLLVAALVVLSVRLKRATGQTSVVSDGKDRTRVTGEMQSRLREEIKHLTASGLSADEASLIAHHRLSDTGLPRAEFAEAPPHQLHANHLYWMVVGILGYLFVSWVGTLASSAWAWLGYAAGVRSVWLVLATGTVHVAVSFLIVVLALRRRASRAQTTVQRAWISLGVGLFAAIGIVLSWWVINSARPFLYRRLSEDGFLQIVGAWRWVGFGWTMLFPFLLAGVLIVLTMRRMPTACSW